MCASCRKGTIAFQTTIDTDETKLPLWLRECDYVQNFIDSHSSFRQKHPNGASSAIQLQLSSQLEGRSILFWAAKHRVGIKVPSAKEAYGDFRNSGVSYVKPDGSVVLKCMCPSVYKAKPWHAHSYKTYPRHIHWMISNTSKTEWLKPVYTTNFICGSSRDQVEHAIRTQGALVINALSEETHSRYNIPNTVSFGHEMVANWSTSKICRRIKDSMKQQVPALVEKASTMGVKLEDLPLIIYCANRQCNAAKHLARYLLRAGFTNLYDYKDGVQGWHSR